MPLLKKEKHAPREGDALPQRIHCERCGAILYEDIELKPPIEIVQRYDGRCPKCGRRLSYFPIKVEIKKIK
jgi:ribosomal protein S27AE